MDRLKQVPQEGKLNGGKEILVAITTNIFF